jgi:NTP pyrophosphatase (non-canonical NTP hydrolase)
VASSTCVACSAQTYTGTVYNDSEHTCSKNPHNSNVSTIHPCTGAITSHHSHYVEGELSNLDSDTDPQSHSLSGPGSSASAYTFDSYQDDAGTTAIYPDKDRSNPTSINYTVLGLIGEAGEIANKYKKSLRDFSGYLTDETRAAILDEIGDVLWYCARLSSELQASLGEVAAANYTKLNDRKRRDVLHGSGDDR